MDIVAPRPTVDSVKSMYKGVPEDGFFRDIEVTADIITNLHPKSGMNIDRGNMLIKGLQILRGVHCTQDAFVKNVDQHKLQNWETDNYIVFSNIYYGYYSDAIANTMNQHVPFPVYICDQMKPHTRFFKAGLFQIIENATVEGQSYLLLQSYQSEVKVEESVVRVRTSKYRSLLEARFAAFLTALGLEFTYEKSMFELQHFDRQPSHIHTYHPDFYIKSLRVHVELKPHFPHVEELDLCEQMAALGYDMVLFYGTDFVPLLEHYGPGTGVEKRHYNQQNALRGMGWSGQTSARVPGEVLFVDRGSVIQLESLTSLRNCSVELTRTPRLLAAYEAARNVKSVCFY